MRVDEKDLQRAEAWARDVRDGVEPARLAVYATVRELTAEVRILWGERAALVEACEDAVEELRTDENYVGDNGAEAEFLVKLRAAAKKAVGQ